LPRPRGVLLLGRALTIELPSGKERRNIRFFSPDGIEEILSIPFEHYGFLGDYVAILNKETGIVEAGIRLNRNITVRSSKFFKTILHERVVQKNEEEENELVSVFKPLTVSGTISGFNITATFVLPSNALLALGRYSSRTHLALQIEGIPKSYHDVTMRFLEKFTDSLFFQIDLLYDSPFALFKKRPVTRRIKRVRADNTSIAFPQSEYDSAPMSLYSYGRSSIGLPLVQFLAFYQVLEFHFPLCYQSELRRRIQVILKEPTFRPGRDIDIARILTLLQSRSGSSKTGERAMLIAYL
jgi:hypothetical protein